MTYLFRSYLLAHSTKTMKSLLHPGTSYLVLASEYHDRLGWDNFVEGRICTLWVETRSCDIADCHLERNTNHWAQDLMRRLLEIVHQQWLYCNATVHMNLDDRITADQHNRILTRMEELLEINPDDLLTEIRLTWISNGWLPDRSRIRWSG